MDELLDGKRDLARAEVELLETLVDYRAALAELSMLVGENLGR